MEGVDSRAGSQADPKLRANILVPELKVNCLKSFTVTLPRDVPTLSMKKRFLNRKTSSQIQRVELSRKCRKNICFDLVWHQKAHKY